jgi:hypothetical protein
MSKTKALKYLVLDTINKYKNSNNSELINKIQNSLNVEDQDINYKITWRTNDTNASIISKSEFKFYERNDIINNENNLNYLEINNKSAEKLIRKILNTKEKNNEKLYPLKLINFIYILTIFIFFFSLFLIKQNKIRRPNSCNWEKVHICV